MENLIKKGIVLLIAPFLFATPLLAQKRTFYVSQEEISRTVEEQKKGRGFNRADIYLRFEILDKLSGNPLSGLETKLQNEKGNISHAQNYYGDFLINPYIDTTDVNGMAIFPIQKDDLSEGKLNNVNLRIRGNDNYFQKQIQFNLGKLIHNFKTDPPNILFDSSLLNQGVSFPRYFSFENYFLPLGKEEDNPSNGFKQIKDFDFNSREFIGYWSRSVLIFPLKIEMDRIPTRLNFDRNK